MSENPLGNAPSYNAKRDAIHIAVAPVRARERLQPGQKVFYDGAYAYATTAEVTGVVDPFLTDMVEPYETFWLVLSPNSITGLRHDWDHPNFPSSDEDSYDDGCRGC